MKLERFKTKKEASRVAARKVAEILKKAIRYKGHACFIAATGKSQLEFLKYLANDHSIDWSKTTLFHLDEYLKLPKTNRASFQRYLNERLINKVHPGVIHFIQGTSKNPQKECARLSELISKQEIDVAFLGVGKNGHIAFNDPPADFETDEPFIIVKLNDANRKQQLEEGWFHTLNDVPTHAISMSIKQIMKSKNIICLIFGERKKKVVKECFSGNISNQYPASILKKHKNAVIYLDDKAGSLIKGRI